MQASELSVPEFLKQASAYDLASQTRIGKLLKREQSMVREMGGRDGGERERERDIVPSELFLCDRNLENMVLTQPGWKILFGASLAKDNNSSKRIIT